MLNKVTGIFLTSKSQTNKAADCKKNVHLHTFRFYPHFSRDDVHHIFLDFSCLCKRPQFLITVKWVGSVPAPGTQNVSRGSFSGRRPSWAPQLKPGTDGVRRDWNVFVLGCLWRWHLLTLTNLRVAGGGSRGEGVLDWVLTMEIF